ncbi:DNA-binding transcriptional regulator, MarR family [Mucilaginibacter gossypiicola]|uniref:DNA-binding transcriptional regulator, MarR family n=1 Tax=Mucilaginibacter gossypiicola TaxID=551995 RepID=A0A1H8S366_9SPHI|nr:MarR family transcriptional regulator [Mucilaginibacter gossypiicola]SEO73032.1 DNA-binding transcriptional regulator, MarR family [Mucilaginibacter gossypiicola]
MDIQQHIQEIRTFNRFYTDLIGLLDKHLLNSEYSLAEARILYEIFTAKQLSASDIIYRLSIDKGYLSRILKKFEKEDLIVRKPSEEDARVSMLSLTDAGLKVFFGLNEASEKQILALISPMSIEQLDELVKHMMAITGLLEKQSR